MSAIATSAPARASVSASARPSPRDPPVTRATRPMRSISSAMASNVLPMDPVEREQLRAVSAVGLEQAREVGTQRVFVRDAVLGERARRVHQLGQVLLDARTCHRRRARLTGFVYRVRLLAHLRERGIAV